MVPTTTARRLCPQAIAVPPDFDAYTDAAKHFPAQVALIILLPAGDEKREAELAEKAAKMMARHYELGGD